MRIHMCFLEKFKSHPDYDAWQSWKKVSRCQSHEKYLPKFFSFHDSVLFQGLRFPPPNEIESYLIWWSYCFFDHSPKQIFKEISSRKKFRSVEQAKTKIRTRENTHTFMNSEILEETQIIFDNSCEYADVSIDMYIVWIVTSVWS